MINRCMHLWRGGAAIDDHHVDAPGDQVSGGLRYGFVRHIGDFDTGGEFVKFNADANRCVETHAQTRAAC